MRIIAALAAAAIGFAGLLEVAEACKMYRPRDPAPRLIKQGKRYEVQLSYTRKYYRFRGGNQRLQKIHFYTRDAKLAKYLQQHGRHHQLWLAIHKLNQKHTCADLYNGARIVQIERTLAKGIARYYRAKTKRYVAAPGVMLAMQYASNPSCRPPAK